MKSTVNLVSAVNSAPDWAATAAPTPATDSAPFSQLLDRFASRAQQDAGASAEANSMPATGEAASPAAETDQQAQVADAMPGTAPAPDAAMIAALLNQMQTPWPRATADVPLPSGQDGVPALATPTARVMADGGAPALPLLASAADSVEPSTSLADRVALATPASPVTDPHDPVLDVPAPVPNLSAPPQPVNVVAALATNPAMPQATPPANPAVQLTAAAAGITMPAGTLSAATPDGDTPQADPRLTPVPSAATVPPAVTHAEVAVARHAPYAGLQDTASSRPAPAENAAPVMDELTLSNVTKAPLAFTTFSAFNMPRPRALQQEPSFDPLAIGPAVATAVHGTATLADAPAAVTIAPRLDAPEWKPAFASSVRALVQDGANSASLQLNPAELGPIDVRIVVHDQRADISFMVKTSEANSALQSALSDLREQLARGGIQLGQASVGSHGQSARGFGDTTRRADRSSSASAAPLSPVAPTATRPRPAGQIDTFA